MLASQLLRILETLPTAVKCDTCVSDSAAQGMVMKENQNITRRFNSKDMGRDSDPLARVGSKEMNPFNGIERDDHPSPFEVNGAEEFWKAQFDDDLFMDNENRTDDFKAEDFQSSAFCRLDSLEDDVDSESSDTNVKDKAQGGPFVAALDLFERDKNSYTDKNVLEYERPELIVCYKEINYHVVKDICVDEGMPANRRVLLDISEDDNSGLSFCHSMSDDEDRRKSTGDVDEEVLISNSLEATTLDDTEPPSEKSSCRDIATGDNLEEPMQKDGMNSGARIKSAMGASEEETSVDNTLPIQEFGTRSFLRSFLNTLDGEESEVQQLPHQVSEEPTAMPQEDVPKSILAYNSEVKTRSITFNFNSLAEQSLDSREMIDQNEAEGDIHSARGQSQRASNNNMSYGNEAGASLRRFDRGEVSFSADSFVSHSGPIPFSGSLSLCSEGSAASGRSFAFPELQSEWNSSPVRMTAADRRRFRRHRGWRSGVLCCRF